MKLASVDNVIERSGDLNDEANFTIALTAKAIEVLSSQIYKDAHMAIVRELGTNAADSHIEAGKRDVPFDVTLPSDMTPEFIIRDYGTGMPYDKVMTMYRTYFGSDKTNSNEVTGCLGLGSKSPLAYTDQFNVTSWYEGEKSVYVIYKNEKGLPAINRIHNEKSDEPTGVEVRISIKRHDFSTFKLKATESYRWFNPRPNVHGIDWPKEEITFQSDGWKLRRDTTQKMTVVMGNVAYGVEKADLNSISSKLTHTERTLMNCGPILYVGIGDVDIAASRETLKFDGPKTLPTIKKLITKMGEEINQKFQEEIEACKTHWEARKHFRMLRHAQPLGSILPMRTKWKGIEVDTQIKLIEWQGTKLIASYAQGKKYSMRATRRSYNKVVSTSTVNNIECEEKAEIFIVDSKNHISRVGHYVRSTDATVYVLSEAAPVDVVRFPEANSYTLDEFFKEFHLKDAVRKTSELPDPPRNVGSNRSKSYQVLSPKPRTDTSSHWTEGDVDFEKGGVYVEVKGNYWSAGTLMVDCKAKRLFELGPVITADKVYGVRSRSLKDFEASPNWVRLDQYMIDQYANHTEAEKMATKAAIYQRVHSSYSYNKTWQIGDFKAKKGETIPDGVFLKLQEMIVDLKKATTSDLAKGYNIALPFIGKKLEGDKEYDAFRKLYAQFENTYPLLKKIDLHDDSNRKAILHYLELIDRKPTITANRCDGANKAPKEILCQTH